MLLCGSRSVSSPVRLNKKLISSKGILFRLSAYAIIGIYDPSNYRSLCLSGVGGIATENAAAFGSGVKLFYVMSKLSE